MTQQLGLLGYPLEHSISPAFQQAAIEHFSLAARYHAWPTPPDRLAKAVNKLRGDGYLGANVTIPHKEEVLGFLDANDPWAKAVGAVNTIAKKGRELVGYNTDSQGFIRSLKEKAGFSLEGKSVLLLGAGGAAKAAAWGLAREGIVSLTIANRTLDRARSLAEGLGVFIDSVTAIPMTRSDLRPAALGADLIVNATSVGMSPGGADGLTPLDGDMIPPSVLVYDMVYSPAETPLLKAAQRSGARTMGGLWMLIFQGAASFELWTGKGAPVDVMFSAAERALSDRTALA